MNYRDVDFQMLEQQVIHLRSMVLCLCRMIDKQTWQQQAASDKLWRDVQIDQDRQQCLSPRPVRPIYGDSFRDDAL